MFKTVKKLKSVRTIFLLQSVVTEEMPAGWSMLETLIGVQLNS